MDIIVFKISRLRGACGPGAGSGSHPSRYTSGRCGLSWQWTLRGLRVDGNDE